jgi:hypothetical protein
MSWENQKKFQIPAGYKFHLLVELNHILQLPSISLTIREPVIIASLLANRPARSHAAAWWRASAAAIALTAA